MEQTVWDENGEERTEVMKGKKEITTHIAIHTLHLDGLRELYRHFLRLPDGALVEVMTEIVVVVNQCINLKHIPELILNITISGKVMGNIK